MTQQTSERILRSVSEAVDYANGDPVPGTVVYTPTWAEPTPCHLDVASGWLTAGDRRVHLSKRLARLLAALAGARGRTVTNEYLVRRLWSGLDGGPEDELRNLRLAVWALRRHLAAVGLKRAVETVWGRGYQLTVPVIVSAPDVLVPAESVAELRALLASHPQRERAELLGWAVFGA
jgi:DNA-binding winged helix-turn-helix (wHTH) protein